MAKIEIDLVRKILQRLALDPQQTSRILDEIQNEISLQNEINEEENIKHPPIKKQYAFIVSDPFDDLKDKEFVGWIVQIPENEHPVTLEEKILRSAYEYNTTPKGQRYPVRTIGEAFESIPAKIFKEQKVFTKHKEPILLIKTRNTIPILDKKKSRED